MLKDIDRNYNILHIAGREYRVRYSLNAMRCLEEYKPLSELLKTKYTEWSIDDVLYLANAAMCSLPKNFKAVNRRDFKNVHPTVQELGEIVRPQDLPALKEEIICAIIAALPEPKNTDEAPKKAMHEGHERAMYVDVIGRSDREYWSSTKKEIADRIECYMEVKGYKDTAELVQEYDDD